MKIANALSLTLGAVLLLISFQWIFMPAVAAETLNMIYLEGEGRNTQIRDFTAFFLATSTMCFLSFTTKKYEFIFSCGLVYMLAAIFNIFASVSHEAPLALSSLVSEIVFTLMAWISAYKYKDL
tara:strand:+ start:393 stop:764 length:372 start_codon:yes stop_codon:yes gene_type:complete